MSHLEELEREGHEELIFPCDCAGDYLRIVWDEDPEWRFLWIEGWVHRQDFRSRIRTAWLILTGRHWQSTEIILNEKTLASLKQFVDSKT